MNGSFPSLRLRRTRQEDWIRKLVQENTLTPQHLIYPMFVIDGARQQEPILSMPGIDRYSIDLAVEEAKKAYDLGIPAIALFPKTDIKLKDEKASEALNKNNLVCTAVQKIKKAVPKLGVMCDVALDPYTSHGHDGIIIGGKIDNDATLEIIREQAIIQAQAGCDILGPSEMMDGRVGVIRQALEKNGFKDTMILAYSAKYASAFYGPFRDAVGSKTSLQGDKRTYQQDPSNSDEALREVALDLQEGADMVMIKPALPYLDIIYRVKETFKVPTFAYHVSGEYAMIMAADKEKWLDGRKAMLESLMAIKRAGADGILTYYAMAFARDLQK